jgi:hypothetical protein
VAFDFQTQSLVDDHDNRVNYLSFLQDYLQAVRLTQYLLTVVERMTLDRQRARTPQREYTDLPIGR